MLITYYCIRDAKKDVEGDGSVWMVSFSLLIIDH